MLSIVPFVKKYKVDPATGNPLEIKALIRLNFAKYVHPFTGRL